MLNATHMIKKIKKLKRFGIFQDFTASSDLSDFMKFNLFYGWNGCGKTTLSRLFASLRDKKIPSDFPTCEFEIVLQDDSSIKSTSIENFTPKVFVFNQQFIEDNIDWKKQGAKSIIVISEDKIEERNRFFTIRDKDLPRKIADRDSRETLAKASEKDKENFLTDVARSIKQSFQLIDTSDSRYLNYDKGKLRTFVNDHEAEIKEGKATLSLESLDELKKRAHPVEKPKITFQFPKRDDQKIIEAQAKINSLIKQEIVSASIKRLQENGDINVWVEAGLKLHQEHNSKTCEFCGQNLPMNLISRLKEHFNIEYDQLITKLRNARNWITEIQAAYSMPDTSDLYEEFHLSYKARLTELQQSRSNFDKTLAAWSAVIEHKLENPFSTEFEEQTDIESVISTLAAKEKEISAILFAHNQKTENFQTELKEIKSTLEKHYISESFTEKKYFTLLEKVAKDQQDFLNSKEKVETLQKELDSLSASLANAAKGAENFNGKLHRFLGRDDISLSYDAGLKGYKILRSKPASPAANLSEGEKTAIAFVYFVIKVEEQGNKISDSVIVLDDPISSFDSNHLFHSLSFVKSHFESALQVFILTHNYNYFKIVRDWLLKKNSPGKIKTAVFAIEVKKAEGRKSMISNAHSSLLKYGSEYHYMFKKLYEYRDDQTVNAEKAYQVANFARKLLEGFFTFKYPLGRSNFYELMDTGCKNAGISDVTSNAVYRFINNYSHSQIIEFQESTMENLLAERDNITQQVFEIISKCDERHYNEMIELCSN